MNSAKGMKRSVAQWVLAVGMMTMLGSSLPARAQQVAPQASGASQPTPLLPQATPMTDLLTRMDALETQVARLTAQYEEMANRQRQIEARLSPLPAPNSQVAAAEAVAPTRAPAPVPATVATPTPEPTHSATSSNLVAMTGGASARSEREAGAARELDTEPDAGPARPSARRVAAVKAVIKPQTGDPGDDDYSYGFRLYTAKFYPEAEQQLRLYIDKYPKDSRISFARNLLGRAYLDDGKPRDAAPWFLMNYKADPRGPRAADSLLNLAESMHELGDNNRACIALNEFASNYADEARGRLRPEYDKTRGGLSCS